ncbi:MAG: ATP-binding protein [Bacteroidales bacterium]|nr:ATP-binding protein [Bacteroidales bacterium]
MLCKPLANQQGYHIVSFVLLFVVSVMAAFLGIGPILLASSVSALVWNYFFIPPHFTFHISGTEDKLMFGSFFFIALINGVLTNRVRRQEKLAREREERTNAIFELTRDLSKTSGVKEVLEVAVSEIKKNFKADSVCFMRGKEDSIQILAGSGNVENMSQVDLKMVDLVFRSSRKAGDTPFSYYPLKGKRLSPGVIAISFEKPVSGEKEIFWTAYLTQISIAVERELLNEIALKARLLDESDKLYKTLFTLISHEFRIPIATIMGASDTLLSSQTTDVNRTELINETFKASARLNHLIENLLNMSRLESGKISVRPDWCEINDLLNKVVQTLKKELEQFHLLVSIPDEMPLVRLDFGLMEQVIYNLILNSCQHSPPGSAIRFETDYNEGYLIIKVEDNGKGFPPELLDNVFNKFFRVDNSKTGGLGLGLSIVKGLVEAHKGTVKVENLQSGGARFTIYIPSEIPDMKKIKSEQ